MKALDYMIQNNLWEYSCDPCSVEPHKSNYGSIKDENGQISYRNETFVIFQRPGSWTGNYAGRSPPDAKIIRVKK